MNTVKVVHSMYFIQRTRGIQVPFKHCMNFYATVNILHSTRGVVVCRPTKKTKEQVIDKLLMERLALIDGRGEMPELSYIVPGPGTKVLVQFEPDAEAAEPLPIPSVTINSGTTSLETGDEVYDSERNQGAEWKLRPARIVITYSDDQAEETE